MLTVEMYFNMRGFYSVKHIAAEFNTTPKKINKALKNIGFYYNSQTNEWVNASDKSYFELLGIPLLRGGYCE